MYNTFNTIVTVATNIDKQYWECLAEKAHEASHSTLTPSLSKSSSKSHQTLTQLFQSPTDPNAMDISARTSGHGKIREDWQKALCDKCYSYSSNEYTIARGYLSKCAICQWCKKAGHTLVVYMTQYLGRPQNDGPPQPQAVHASMIPEASKSMSTLSRSASIVMSEDVAAIIWQIAELNKSLLEICGNFS